MKKLFVLGNSIAAVKAVELIQSNSNDYAVTLLPVDDHLPLDRQLFPDQIANQTRVTDLLYRPAAYYKEKNIKILADKKVTRVNVTRNRVHFEDRSQTDFDALIIADTPEHRSSDIKGAQKTGVFGFKKIKDIEQISTLAAISETVIIQSDQWWGLGLALRLARKGKEIILCMSSRTALLHGWDEDASGAVVKLLEEQGVKLLIDNPVTEFLGDAELKAVRVSTGKVYATGMAIVDDTRLDTRVFNDALEILEDQCIVNEFFQSNIEHVFVVDHAAQRSYENWESYGPSAATLERQGEIVASRILGQDIEPTHVTPRYTIEQDQFKFMSAGQTRESRGVEVIKKFDVPTGMMVKLYEKQGRVIGLSVLNFDVALSEAIGWIEQSAEIGAVAGQVLAAFDEQRDHRLRMIETAETEAAETAVSDAQT